jgi:hypothetical protein
MKRTNLLTLGALLLAGAASGAVNKGVIGSDHDFSKTNYITWNTRRGVCTPCHTAHATDPNQLIPLWAHKSSTGPFVMYSSPTIHFVPGTAPEGSSLACLSCHDGTVAVNALLVNPNTNIFQTVSPNHKVGPDLHQDHPISFVYDAALAATDGALENPVTYHIGDPKTSLTIQTPPVPPTWLGTSLSGKSIDEALLVNHKMECVSCHDPHFIKGSTPGRGQATLIDGNDADGRGSLQCRTCHIK